MNREELTPDLVLMWIKINGGKYVVNTFEAGGEDIYYLLENGNWASTEAYGMYNPAAYPDINKVFEAKVFDSVDEAKQYLQQNGVYIDEAEDTIPLDQIQNYVNQDESIDEFAVCIGYIPTYDSVMNVANNNQVNVNNVDNIIELFESLMIGDLKDYDKDTWIEFQNAENQ